eukprot:TRINITY_DN102476_c0_g1_i1.p1 TRINITY_DN102476_c0_g1~~TRINITY_DN102476_c0_g1_i1.p1  ORF type:complete len:1180 (+),score=247.81 TRINITY_DN102476_c0_g1_i1:82-3540(+)
MSEPAPPRTPPTQIPSRPGSRGAYPPPSAGLIRSSSQGSLRPASGGDDGLVRSGSTGSLRPASAHRNSSREHLEPLAGSPQAALAAASAAADLRTTPRERQGSASRLAPLPPVSTASATALGSGRGIEGSGSGSGGRSRPGTGRSDGEPPPLSPDSLNPKIKFSKASLGLPEDPPAPHSESRLRKEEPKTRGPVKWVPHTHANPKHAKFCFICLHGKLEGERDNLDEEVQRQQQEGEDLPSPVEMKELGYLLSTPAGQTSNEGNFRRSGADYERNNITALWLREVLAKIYNETVKGMVAEQNTGLSLGVDVKLVNHKEDEQDRRALVRLFTMSDEEREKVDKDIADMGEWCTNLEGKLLDVMPPPRPLGNLPEVPEPTEKQKELLVYQSLVDFSTLKGSTALDAKSAMLMADGMLNRSKTLGADKSANMKLFKVEDLALPLTQPDMAEVEVVPYPLSTEDVPEYEPLHAMKPTRQPIDALTDPFQRPFLYLAEFIETVMPVFEGTSVYGDCVTAEAVAAEEQWLTLTRSIFADNNPPDEETGWGYVPPRKRVMPVLIDEPYLPPFDLVSSERGGGRRLMLRGIWDPELFHQGGEMVPPLKERGRGLYQVVPVEHPDQPNWSKVLSPPQSREQKITNLIPTIPVKSWTRFRPKKVLVEMPDFLWDLVRQDAAGQGLWDVVTQRHDIPREEREREEAVRKAKEKDLADEQAKVQATLEAEQAALKAMGEEAGQTGDAPQAVDDATMRQPLTEHTAGLPLMEVPPPETPQVDVTLPPAPVGGAPLGTGPLSVPPRSSPGPGGATMSPPMTAGFETQDMQDHRMRTTCLVKRGGEGRKVEEILSDDRFLDSLAMKITQRIGGGAVDMLAAANTTQGTSFRAGGRSLAEASAGVAMVGKPTIMRPDPPSFAEPTDGQSKAQLPRALQTGGSQVVNSNNKQSADPSQAPMTSTDVNSFTQEKMRGECYVRLLVHPDSAAAKKAIIPYQGDMLTPDISLVMGTNRPHLVVPPKPPYLNEEGEYVEDDEFADFEKHDNVAFSFVRHNRFEAMEALIQQENDIVNAKDENGNNLLHIACQNDHRRIAKLLLKNGTEVNHQNNKGNTPLHYVFQYNFMQLSDYLIAHGADETIANKAGLMPAQGTGVEDPIGVAQRNLGAGK